MTSTLLDRLRQLPELERLELVQALRVSVEQDGPQARDLLARRWNIEGTDEERSALADSLYDDLYPDVADDLEASADDAGGLHPEWDAEMARRIAEIKNGTAQLIPADDVWAEMGRRWGVKRKR